MAGRGWPPGQLSARDWTPSLRLLADGPGVTSREPAPARRSEASWRHRLPTATVPGQRRSNGATPKTGRASPSIARADDDAGEVTIARSRPLDWPPTGPASLRALTDAVETLEAALLAAGWRPLPQGSAWYAKRFIGEPSAESAPSAEAASTTLDGRAGRRVEHGGGAAGAVEAGSPRRPAPGGRLGDRERIQRPPRRAARCPGRDGGPARPRRGGHRRAPRQSLRRRRRRTRRAARCLPADDRPRRPAPPGAKRLGPRSGCNGSRLQPPALPEERARAAERASSSGCPRPRRRCSRSRSRRRDRPRASAARSSGSGRGSPRGATESRMRTARRPCSTPPRRPAASPPWPVWPRPTPASRADARRSRRRSRYPARCRWSSGRVSRSTPACPPWPASSKRARSTGMRDLSAARSATGQAAAADGLVRAHERALAALAPLTGTRADLPGKTVRALKRDGGRLRDARPRRPRPLPAALRRRRAAASPTPTPTCAGRWRRRPPRRMPRAARPPTQGGARRDRACRNSLSPPSAALRGNR